MRLVEIAVAAACLALGVRSLIHWIHRPFWDGDTIDQALFALFVTGRVGTWLGLAGLFALYASMEAHGQAFRDDVADFAWYLLVLIALAALQVVAGFLLGRRTPRP